MDNKAPMLACMFAAHELTREFGTPKRPLRLIFGCNEESGWGCMDKYVKDHGAPDEGFSPDGDFPVINCEKGMAYYEITLPLPEGIIKMDGGTAKNMVMDELAIIIMTKEKRFFYGKSAHASKPHLGKNAFETVGGFFEKFCDHTGSELGIACSDAESGALTVACTMVRTEGENVVLTVDVRYPISSNKFEIMNKLQDAFPDAKITTFGGHDSLYHAKDSPIVKNLLAAYKTVTGEDGEPIAIGGGTYARAMKNGVAFGPQFANSTPTIHQPDECESLRNLWLMYKIYKQAIKSAVF
jgi:succinyl-diaminopimelate desuccinylase